MQLKIFNLEKQEIGKIKLPAQFEEEVREDLIKRAVLSLRSARRQRYGAFAEAGKRPSAKISRRRRDYKGAYGKGISRVPRKTLNRRGMNFYWVGAFAPGTVGGRAAHPPKSEKILFEKINKKEKRKAIRSALSAAVNAETVRKRGHIIPNDYPFIISDDIENMSKAKELIEALKKLGFEEEIKRASKKSIRAGKGRARGRKYKKRKGLLLVVSKDCKLINAAGNLPVDVKKINEINAEDLAPGGVPGRAALFTPKSLETIEKEKMFE